MPEWLEVIVRTFVSVIVMFAFTKVLGKRQISQLSLFEYITGITIGSITAYISVDVDTNWYLGIVALAVWVLVSYTIELLQMKSKKSRDLIDGTGTILIKGGKILEDNLKKEKLTNQELMEQLRKKSIFQVSQVEFALMEPSGEVSVLLKSQYLPITPSALGVKVSPESEPQEIILDGNIMEEPLATSGLSRQWLNTELEKLGVSLDNVFLGQVDSYGQLNVDLYDDKLQVPQPQTKAVLLAELKKCEADLEMFALSTNEPPAKTMYGECSIQLQQVIDQVRPILSQ